MRPATPIRASRGFTLVEVLIAVVIMACGLLGLAKMQALALSSTKVSGTRSLVALQAASLVSAMHANSSGFWATGAAPAVFTTGTGGVQDNSHVLDTGLHGYCTAYCAPADMAANDVKTWSDDLQAQFPGATARIDCTTTPPVNCTIHVTWSEKSIAMNQTAAAGAGSADQVFSINVKP